ncbi:hypothetical protein Q7P37_011469 [Cladosporium fusiforme]
MGLAVDEHGRYRGWLASFLCCCFALTEDEHPKDREGHNSSATTKNGTYHQQRNFQTPPSLPTPVHATPSTKSDYDTSSLHDSRSSDTFNLSKALDFDTDPLFPQSAKNGPEHTRLLLPWPTTEQTKPSIQPPREAHRTRRSPSGSFSAQSLVPLPLGPVVLRDPYHLTQTTSHPAVAGSDYASAKQRHRRSESTQDLLAHSTHQPYFETRETPYQRCSRRSTETLAMRSIPSKHTKSAFPTHNLPTSKYTMSTPSLSNSFKSHAQKDSSTSAMTLADRSRTGSGARLQRKRSNHSHLSHSNAGDSDVEKEVLELNTIVEERRAETNKARSRHSHVPAVAPSMQIRARSETLNDIGSALSRPLTTRVEEDNGDENPRPRKSKTSKSFVSGWLSNVTTSSSTHYDHARQTYTTPAEEPFYNNLAATVPRARPVSVSSSATALDSTSAASYTLEASPTVSKRYSRSLMITPLPSVDDDDDGRSGVSELEGCESAKQVGVAL